MVLLRPTKAPRNHVSTFKSVPSFPLRPLLGTVSLAKGAHLGSFSSYRLRFSARRLLLFGLLPQQGGPGSLPPSSSPYSWYQHLFHRPKRKELSNIRLRIKRPSSGVSWGPLTWELAAGHACCLFPVAPSFVPCSFLIPHQIRGLWLLRSPRTVPGLNGILA